MKNSQHGMSLVELMVGILIGLLMVAAATGSLTYFDAQRRTSLAGAASANGGMMAGYVMQRDLRNAGIGLMNASQLACAQLNLYFDGATRSNGNAIAPVQIIDGGAGSDGISMFFVDSVLGSAPLKLTRGLVTAGESLRVSSESGLEKERRHPDRGCHRRRPMHDCADLRASNAAPAPDVELVRSAGADYPWNAPNPATAFADAPLYPAGGVVMKIGKWDPAAPEVSDAITWRSYDVTGSTLNATDLVTNTAIAVGTNVVNLQAQYGVTDGVSNEIRRWVDATAEWQNPTVDLIGRIRAVRFAVIARSPKREPNNDGTNCTTTPASPAPWVDAAPVDLSADPEWRCYRYQIFTSIAPLKNVVWSLSQ